MNQIQTPSIPEQLLNITMFPRYANVLIKIIEDAGLKFGPVTHERHEVRPTQQTLKNWVYGRRKREHETAIEAIIAAVTARRAANENSIDAESILQWVVLRVDVVDHFRPTYGFSVVWDTPFAQLGNRRLYMLKLRSCDVRVPDTMGEFSDFMQICDLLVSHKDDVPTLIVDSNNHRRSVYV